MTNTNIVGIPDEQSETHLASESGIIGGQAISDEQIIAELQSDREFLAERARYWFKNDDRGAVCLRWVYDDPEFDFDQPIYVGCMGKENVDKPGTGIGCHELQEYVKAYDPATEYVVTVDLSDSYFIARCKSEPGDNFVREYLRLTYEPKQSQNQPVRDC